LPNSRRRKNAIRCGSVSDDSFNLSEAFAKLRFHFWDEPLGFLAQCVSESVVIFLNQSAGEVRMGLSSYVDNVQNCYLPPWWKLE